MRPPLARVLIAALVVPTLAAASPPPSLLARAPYVGVACSTANLTTCDRVGLSVWLRRPARRVTARLGARTMRLDDREWSGPPDRKGLRQRFAGFLKPAGLKAGPLAIPARWTGDPAVSMSVELCVVGADGVVQKLRVRVGLSPGWG